MTGDGDVPLPSRVIDGGAAEISQTTGTMDSLYAMAGPQYANSMQRSDNRLQDPY
ncbi:hypothetical protein AB0D59_42445 [Streptomyces sp. NPDC048417]|uniref:hypothetical protein n=1 Tax=Streptomyces sp. NPDC048417 TaxID=3155387 RepID=UPI00343AA052